MPAFLQSGAFWSVLAGAASSVIGAVDPGSSLKSPVQSLLIAVGGLLMAIPAHHVIKTQQAAKTTSAPPPPPISA